jgi:chromate transporter
MADLGPRHVPLSSLFRSFLRIGLTAFGGLGASIAIIESEFVERRQLLTAEDLSEALAATRFSPGSTLIQVVSYLAYRLGGWPGSVLATSAFLLPSAVLMLLLAALPLFPTSSPIGASLLHGLDLTVVGLLLASTCRLACRSLGNPLAVALAVGALASGGPFKLPAALIVVTAGLIGMLWPPTGGGTGQGRVKEEVAG